MSNRTRCTLAVLCLSLVLCLPLQAQTGDGRVDTLSSFFSALWECLYTPIASLWAADEMDGGLTLAPLGEIETTDGRGAADPNGLTVDSDGRGACDPDGATACGS